MTVWQQYGLPEPAFTVSDSLSVEEYTVTFKSKLSENVGFQQTLQLIIDDCQARLDAIASACEDSK